MTRNQLDDWLRLHCDPNTDYIPLLDKYAGWTEDEMDQLLDEHHGSIS